MATDPAAKAFGQRLKALRIYRRLTIDDLALKSGLHKATINNLELGRYLPMVRTLRALDAALGSKVEDFEIPELETA